jgi:NADH-quinone oxidoreductase subunit L
MIETLVALLLVLPLIGVVINTFWVRRGRQAGVVASAVMAVAFAVSLAVFALLLGRPAEERAIDFTLYEWIAAGPLRVPFGILLDPLSMVMVLLITGVGFLIHVFSIGYMAHDSRPVRYWVYLNLFVSSMLVLVLANNYLLMFLGWEGVGLCSYLLIGHSFERREARDASLKAFIVNRIGDIGLLMAILLIYSLFGTLIFQQVFSRSLEVLSGVPLAGFSAATLLCLLMFIGVAGKSAQIPLFVWLPDAMSGPTPASALIHAATMVTSGVYLIARSHTIWSIAAPTQTFVVYVAALTAFVAASIAIGQYDIKKVLAYSTVSQLGFMVAAVAAGAYVAGIFHLLTHGVFKALLFLAAGSVIHGTNDTQDMRRMGGLRRAMPRTFWTYVVGALALSGIFPLAGFWSKDEIIGSLWNAAYTPAAIILMITSMLTAFYMARQISLVFLGTPRDPSVHPHESEPVMTVPLVILAVGAVLIGFINTPFFHGLATFLEPSFTNPVETVVNYGTMFVTLVLAVVAGYIGYRVYALNTWRKTFRDPLVPYLGVFFEGFETAWGSDSVVRSIIRPFRGVASFLARVVDPRGIDGVVNGAARLVGWSGEGLRQSQSGYLRSYALVFLVGAVAVIGYFSFLAR